LGGTEKSAGLGVCSPKTKDTEKGKEKVVSGPWEKEEGGFCVLCLKRVFYRPGTKYRFIKKDMCPGKAHRGENKLILSQPRGCQDRGPCYATGFV